MDLAIHYQAICYEDVHLVVRCSGNNQFGVLGTNGGTPPNTACSAPCTGNIKPLSGAGSVLDALPD